MTADPPPGRSGPSSRALIVMLLVGAVIVALLPVIIARTRQVHTMRDDLAEVVGECRERYASARTAADTAVVDSVRPTLHGVQRPGDPACGPYRRRNMTKPRSP